jgi:hypothetical protein
MIMAVNYLKVIHENNEKIAELQSQIKAIQKESDTAMEKVLLNGIKDSGRYHLRETVTTRRQPITDKVMAILSDAEIRKFAVFTIKGLETVMSKDAVDAVCSVSESVKRVVVME